MAGKLRVCVLQCATDCSTGALSEVDPDRKPEMYDTAGEYEWTTVFIRKATSAAQLVQLAGSGLYDVYLNLCDGAWDEDRAGKDVVEALERLNLPYTGANAAFYEPTKVEMKMAAQTYGVTVPAWVHIRPQFLRGLGAQGAARSRQDSADAADGPAGQDLAVEAGIAEVLAPLEAGGLRFPLIVKHPCGYSSVGMTQQSKVSCEQELREQVYSLVRQFGGALVEEFVEGREFTVLVVEEPADLSAPDRPAAAAAAAAPAAADDAIDAALSLDPDLCTFRPVSYTPVECVFGPGEDFKHFDLKWRDDATCSWRRVDEQEPQLAERLEEDARKTFIATRGVGYGRCDFRVDASGAVYLLEINPNPGMLYRPAHHGSGDFVLTLDPQHDHATFIRTIIASALARHRLKQPKMAPRFLRSARPKQPPPPPPPADATAAAGGAGASGAEPPPAPLRGACGDWGLAALVPISAGEVVQRNEQRRHVLASRGFVARCWPEGSRHRQWFDAYAYPISDEVFVTWSDDPADWAPINHSCDPNTWLLGLDTVARRDIEPGEQITIDYATFYVEGMEPFDCRCGATCCRGRITGTDYLQPWVAERYGSHISAYIAERRRRAGVAS